MSVESFSKNSKSLLAKLLAEENLKVEHKADITTASFNIETRTVNLPIWKEMSSELYDLLVGHEVSHALYTPKNTEDLKEAAKRSNASFVNVVEDVRVEKMIKSKFPGLRLSFKTAYKNLYEEDFFGIKDSELKNINLIDKINVFFKLRTSLGLLPTEIFSQEEMRFVSLVESCKTFDDVSGAAAEIYDYLCEKSKDEDPELQEEMSELHGEYSDDYDDDYDFDFDFDGGDSESDDGSDSEDSSDESNESGEDSEPTNAGDNLESGSGYIAPNSDFTGTTKISSMISDEFESKTNDMLNSNLSYLVDSKARDIRYINVPRVLDYKDYLVDYKEVIVDMKHQISQMEENEIYGKSSYNGLIQENTKTINYLVKEFEMRKAAKAYSKSSMSKTGSINTSKLWSYKINEDIFLQKMSIPEGKNHGMLMVVDWSGSMSDKILDTVKQTIVLANFCRRVNIPFEVYNFTSESENYISDYSKYDDNDMVPAESVSLRNVLSSRMNAQTFKDASAMYLRIADMISGNTTSPRAGYYFLRKDCLGSTPLNSTLLILDKLIPDYKKSNSLEKLNMVILTDGEPTDRVTYKHIDKCRYSGELEARTSMAYGDIILRDPESGIMKTIRGGWSYGSRTESLMQKSLIEYIREKHGVTSVGFYLLASIRGRALSEFLSSNRRGYMSTEEYRQLRAEFKKNKFLTLTSSGHDNYYVIDASVPPKTDDLNVTSTMSKAMVAKNFMKHSRSKTVNRQLLNKFVDIVK